MRWRMLASSTTTGEAPMQKAYSGMVHFTEGEEDLLFVVGGYGRAGLSLPQLGAQYYQLPGGYARTNEVNIFSLSTNRWSIVTIAGQAPPPCSSFTLTMVGEKRAAMFGGSGADASSDLFIMELGRYNVNWTKVNKPAAAGRSVQWPGRRHGHASSQIKGSVFLMVGGDCGTRLSDVWLCDCTTKQWKQLHSLPKLVMARGYHSLSVFHLGDRCVWIVMFGGSPYIANTTIIELVQSTDDEWSVGEVMQRYLLSNKSEYLERLKEGRIKRILRSLDDSKMLQELEQKIRQLQQQLRESKQALVSSQRRTKEVEEENQLLNIQLQVHAGAQPSQEQQHNDATNIDEREKEEKEVKHGQPTRSEHGTPGEPPSSLHVMTEDDIVHAYDVSLRASKKREHELKEELTAAQRDSQEKDKQCSKLENDYYDMYKKMVAAKYDYEQAQEQLEKVQQKAKVGKLFTHEGIQVDTLSSVVHDYVTKLTASEENQQELLLVLDQTKRMGYARDLQISMLESDGHLMLEKFDQLKRKNQLLEDKLSTQELATSSLSDIHQRGSNEPTIKPRSMVEAAVQANYLAVAPDFLRGVEVYKETVLEVVGDMPQKVEWPGYGFYIEVPEGAVPPGVTASVGVKVILAGQFKFPENSQLISAIYWVSSSMVFLKEVAVNIQHCAVTRSEDQCSQFKFIIAKCSQKELPYTFREREGLFNTHTHYGAIKLKQFSILAQTAPEGTDTLCTALMFYKQRIACPLTIVFHFVVVRDLEPYLQKVRQNYEKWNEDHTTFEVCIDDDPSPAIKLDQQVPEESQWKILPLATPTQITKASIKNYQLGRRIPHCGFEFQLVSENKSSQDQQICHEVVVTGVSTLTTFHVRYPQTEGPSVSIVTSPSPALAPSTSVVIQPPSAFLTPVLQTPAVAQTLTMSQTPAITQHRTQTPHVSSAASKSMVYSQAPTTADLMIHVAKKTPTKWYQVGILLNIEIATLNAFEVQTTDPVRLCVMVFDQWKREDKVPYTWDTIISTLEAVDENSTATMIREWLDK